VSQYVLTERGKLALATLIMFFLVMPSLIVVVWILSRDTSPNDPTYDSHYAEQSEDDQNPSASDTGSNQDPSLSGPIAFDSDAGIITFLFTPGLQTTLDDSTISMIELLLDSPVNTAKSKIAVEIPRLSDDDTAVVTTAIIDVFNEFGVLLSDLVFYVYQAEANIQTFRINISIQDTTS